MIFQTIVLQVLELPFSPWKALCELQPDTKVCVGMVGIAQCLITQKTLIVDSNNTEFNSYV